MLETMSPRADPLAPLAARLDVAEAVDSARSACLDLRRHPVLRRQGEAAAVEAGVRAARASAALDGARLPLDAVRDAVRGAAPYPSDAAGQTVRGAVRAHAETERFGTLWQRAPMQALARLHVAAGAGLVDEAALGRPRLPGEQPQDGQDLLAQNGSTIAAVDGEKVGKRLKALGKLLAKPGAAVSPGLLVAAVVHAEVAVLRPFVAANGVVARALCRAVMVGRGVDTTGVVVWEAGLLAMGPRYPLSLAEYAGGDEDGVAGWVRTFSEAVRDGADEGAAVCDAVQAGRLNAV